MSTGCVRVPVPARSSGGGSAEGRLHCTGSSEGRLHQIQSGEGVLQQLTDRRGRFLGVDPARIGVWGSSAGGTLCALLGTTGPAAGFDTGEYLEQTSTVAGVVDMFGPADLAHFDGADAVYRLSLHIGLGDDPDVLRAASPDTYVAPGAAPVLILQGDDFVRPQSTEFAERLRAAGGRVISVPVHGTGHTLDTPGQDPSPGQLTTIAADFLTEATGAAG